VPRFVEHQHIDLLVMSTVSRTGIAGFLIGNNAERLLDAVRCWLLLMKPEALASPVRPLGLDGVPLTPAGYTTFGRTFAGRCCTALVDEFREAESRGRGTRLLHDAAVAAAPTRIVYAGAIASHARTRRSSGATVIHTSATRAGTM